MSELDELIKINKNIEAQNEEIIRLLKKIAGEEDETVEEEIEEEIVETKLLDTTIDVGEVYFVEQSDIYKLTVKDGESVIDNLSGSSKANDYSIQEMVAKESVKNNQSLDDATVILSDSAIGNLPNALMYCVDEGAKKVYCPWKTMVELIGAPQHLQTLIQLDFYKTPESLLEKLF